MNKPTEHFKQIAARMDEGNEKFIAFAMTVANLTRAEAVIVLGKYKKAKVMRIDACAGTFHVIHGAYLDSANLRHAVTA